MKNTDSGADRVAIRFRADQSNANASVSGELVVAIKIGGAVVGRDQQIEIAVAIKIAVSQAAPDFGLS